MRKFRHKTTGLIATDTLGSNKLTNGTYVFDYPDGSCRVIPSEIVEQGSDWEEMFDKEKDEPTDPTEPPVTFSQPQIDAVTKWLNEFGFIKNSSVARQFSEDFSAQPENIENQFIAHLNIIGQDKALKLLHDINGIFGMYQNGKYPPGPTDLPPTTIVPFQLCPKCQGEGKLNNTGVSTSVFKPCDVCHGRKIISQAFYPKQENSPVKTLPASKEDIIKAFNSEYDAGENSKKGIPFALAVVRGYLIKALEGFDFSLPKPDLNEKILNEAKDQLRHIQNLLDKHNIPMGDSMGEFREYGRVKYAVENFLFPAKDKNDTPVKNDNLERTLKLKAEHLTDIIKSMPDRIFKEMANIRR